MADGTCAVEDCEIGEGLRRGWCTKHYIRWWRHGDPLYNELDERWTPEGRWQEFWSRVEVGDCWEWQGARQHGGYGLFAVGRRPQRRVLAHRWAWEALVGPIPEGLTLDHLCRNPPCVNPDHMEPVSMGVNVMRGYHPWSKNARKTACVNGHPFTIENTTKDSRGNRACRTCRRLWKVNQRKRVAAKQHRVGSS